MNIALVYIYPMNGAAPFWEKAVRFVESYHLNPPGIPHSTIIVCNNGDLSGPHNQLFSTLLNPTFIFHNNSGKDIGGYIKVAKTVPADLMVFCGATAYFRKPGWMGRVVESFQKHGDTAYSCTGHQGCGGVQPHLRTTGFWCRPSLLTEYCPEIISNDRRYEFEHGVTCFSTWLKNSGRTPWVVTQIGEYPLHACDSGPGGYHNGDQRNLLIGDRMTEPPYYVCS